MGAKKTTKIKKTSKKYNSPKSLDTIAKEKWNEIFPILENQNMVTISDYLALELLCQAYSEMTACFNKMIEVAGSLEMYLSDKNSQTAPLYTSYNKSREVYFKLIKEFGMTPRSRKGVAVEANVQSFDPVDNLIDNDV